MTEGISLMLACVPAAQLLRTDWSLWLVSLSSGRLDRRVWRPSTLDLVSSPSHLNSTCCARADRSS